MNQPLPISAASKKRLFVMPDGKNLAFTFFLVASLFFIWGFCNGMIDVMDKHFQDRLNLSKAESAWVQFAHYMGYALMALPAGMLTRKIGYKGGIIFGLILVAIGGFWFFPATQISQFWAFLLGVCLIAMGLTVLETVANPYTTVLGPKEFAASRINLAQSFNGVGWIVGPLVGTAFFYAEGANEKIHIPYVGVGIVVLVVAALFFFARVPDVVTEDEYNTDNNVGAADSKPVNRPVVLALMFLNVAALGLSIYLVCLTILPFCGVDVKTINGPILWIIIAGVLVAFPFLRKSSQAITTQSIWAHPHFSGATLAQFFYVAAQAGIFSFLINTLTVDRVTGYTLVPAIPQSWAEIGWLKGLVTTGADGLLHISDKGAGTLAAFGSACFLLGRVLGAAWMKKTPAHKVLALFGICNIVACLLIVAQIGWISVACLFLTYFFMSIMFPTIFAVGIHGLGTQSKKKAAAFIVMSITGGALMPKVMGYLGDTYNMAVGYWMPFGCFVLITAYAYFWPKLAQSEGVTGLKSTGGH